MIPREFSIGMLGDYAARLVGSFAPGHLMHNEYEATFLDFFLKDNYR